MEVNEPNKQEQTIPLVSIVIPTYNRAHFIANTLRSVLNQTSNNFEVVIIDDGSTDQTEEAVLPFLSHQVRYFKIENSERGAARNQGTQLARGMYLNWFDSDDEMLPNHVATIEALATQYQFPPVITLHYAIKDQQTGAISTIAHHYSPSQKRRKDFLIEGNFLACNPVVVKRTIACEFPFVEDRNLSASEDYELWLRLKARFPFTATNQITSYLIQHDERSVNTMTSPVKLENRFLTFLKLTEQDAELKSYLGSDWNYFVMRNYLVLAVDLAYNKHRLKAIRYVSKAFFKHGAAIQQRLFWATVKHVLRS